MFFRRTVPRGMRLVSIPVDRIVPSPRQPRREINEQDVEKLAASIRRIGIIQPLLVSERDDGGFELISGERRLRAARAAGLAAAPCVVITDKGRLAELWPASEALHTAPLSVFEESEGIRRMIDGLRLSQSAAADLLGITPGELNTRLKILRLNDVQRRKLTDAGIGVRHISYIARIDPRLRDRVIDAVVSGKLTEADTERLASGALEIKKETERPKRTGAVRDMRLFDNSLARLIDAMCASGVKAVSTKRETDGYLEYVIRVGKGATVPEKEDPPCRQLPLF